MAYSIVQAVRAEVEAAWATQPVDIVDKVTAEVPSNQLRKTVHFLAQVLVANEQERFIRSKTPQIESDVGVMSGDEQRQMTENGVNRMYRNKWNAILPIPDGGTPNGWSYVRLANLTEADILMRIGYVKTLITTYRDRIERLLVLAQQIAVTPNGVASDLALHVVEEGLS